MMTSPESYIERFDTASYQTLIHERNNLIKRIHQLEEEIKSGDRLEICPSPEVQLSMSHMYLSKLCELIYNRDDNEPFEITEISNDTIKDYDDIDYTNIQAFMFAEGGAMGEPGAINFITKSDGVISAYHANCIFGDFDWNNVKEIFPSIKDFEIGMFGQCDGDNKYFYYVDLGMGNHLFVRKRIQDEFDYELGESTPPERFGKWFETVIAILETEY